MMAPYLAKLRLHLPQMRPFFPHAGALLFFGLLGWLNGYFHANRSVDNPNLRDTWAVPTWSPYRAGPERATLAALDMWDGKKSQKIVKQEAQPQQTWQLVGTVRTGKTFTAIIQLGDGRIRRSSLGDALPNGEKILDVGNGYLQIDVSGNQQEIKLFQQGKK